MTRDELMAALVTARRERDAALALAEQRAGAERAAIAILAHLPDDDAMKDEGCGWTEYMESRDFEALRALVPALRAALANEPPTDRGHE
jgi:hypothetical protein